ncbi:hypothetical protein HME9304_00044 [Flagellimonas maritima]|uniref:Uncharacterized protein n=1 Tax=Flagellimonas maritima TaxID=1383885 RepID=A0A2Z4LP60_9FLAO|nr:hypothetical protein HME9304_00044 [Allomuricauda aurantiaca]
MRICQKYLQKYPKKLFRSLIEKYQGYYFVVTKAKYWKQEDLAKRITKKLFLYLTLYLKKILVHLLCTAQAVTEF